MPRLSLWKPDKGNDYRLIEEGGEKLQGWHEGVATQNLVC